MQSADTADAVRRVDHGIALTADIAHALIIGLAGPRRASGLVDPRWIPADVRSGRRTRDLPTRDLVTDRTAVRGTLIIRHNQVRTGIQSIFQLQDSSSTDRSCLSLAPPPVRQASGDSHCHFNERAGRQAAPWRAFRCWPRQFLTEAG